MNKICYLCKAKKPTGDFNKNKQKSDGLQDVCRTCAKLKSRQYYRQNKTKQLQVVKNYRAIRQIKVKIRIDEIKATSGCALCKENDPVCLEFHHLDPKTKKFDVSTKLRDYKWSRLVKEMNKCVIVCSNCHKKIHANKRTIPSGKQCSINT